MIFIIDNNRFYRFVVAALDVSIYCVVMSSCSVFFSLRSGLIWSGPVWSCLVWSGPVWSRLVSAVSVCEAVQVSVRDERRFAMLFQSVVLPCHYTSVSSQTPVIQWWYKSYCRDRSRDAFRFPDTLAVHGSELGSSVHLDCGDSGRTVRIVASGQGSSITLAEHYKDRDISIINSESQLHHKSEQQIVILIID